VSTAVDLYAGPRSEVAVAADAVWSLFAARLVARTPETVARAAQAAGVTVADLREADIRRERHRYCPPRRDVDRRRHDDRPDDSQKRWRQGTALGRDKAAQRKSRQPQPGQRTMVCAACGNDLALVHFEKRPDRPGKRRTTCITCRREASRDRYLSVAKQRTLNTARLTFVISGNDETLALACIDCGELFVAGDEVEGAAQLRHTTCREGLDR
jgi:hypothetical protein